MTLNVEHNVSLQNYNTMAVPTTASHFLELNSSTEIVFAIEYAKHYKLDIIVLGEGSNTLFSSEKIQALVLLNRIKGINVIEQTKSETIVDVSSGEEWHAWVEYAVSQGWYGLENLALIPGLVGAAPIQNIGAYGVELKDAILEVEYFDIETQKRFLLTNRDCKFNYRDSVFKNELKDKTIITKVRFKLDNEFRPVLHYPSLNTQLSIEDIPDARSMFEMICSIRSKKLPSPTMLPNTGSFFKNPIVTETQFNDLKVEYPNIVGFNFQDGVKLAAAWMIEEAGWKKKSLSKVSVHSEQALVVINPLKESASTVLQYASDIQNDIFQKFKIRLEIEPRVY